MKDSIVEKITINYDQMQHSHFLDWLEENKQNLVEQDKKPNKIYLVSNETDSVIESCFYNFLDAKIECKKWEKAKPQKSFMVVVLEIN